MTRKQKEHVFKKFLSPKVWNKIPDEYKHRITYTLRCI